MNDVLDETYQRLHGTGPEFVGWLSNHGPMAADALIRLGRGADVERWVEEYAQRRLWRATYETAWAVAAAITSAYRPRDAGPASAATAPDTDEMIDRAVATRDEHAIKFVEVARESHGRGNPDALAAGDRAARLLRPA